MAHMYKAVSMYDANTNIYQSRVNFWRVRRKNSWKWAENEEFSPTRHNIGHFRGEPNIPKITILW